MAQTIGFIGLGIMGRPMAKNLLKAGYPLVVHSRSQGPVQELVGAGAKAAGSAADVAGSGRRADHDAAELSRRRAGGARQGWHHRGSQAGSALPRHVDDLSARLSEGRQGARRPRVSACWTRRSPAARRAPSTPRCPSWSGGEKADFDAALPVFQAHGQDHHPPGPAGRGRLHQARQPDHRRGEPDRARRGAHPGHARRGSTARSRSRRWAAGSPARSAWSRRRRTTCPARTSRGSRSTCTSRTSG